MEWVLGITVVLAAAVTLVIVDRMRKVRLRKRVRLDITNAGNVRSRYDLRAQDPDRALQFQFLLEGDNLPVYGSGSEELPGAKAGRAMPSGVSAGGAMHRLGQAIQLGAAAAGVLSMVGSLLPRSIGAPLQQKASQIRHLQAKTSYAQQTPERLAFQASSVARSVTGRQGDPPMRAGRRILPEELQSKQSPSARGPVGDGSEWAQTPYVQPGDTLALELHIRSRVPLSGRMHAFQVISYTADQEESRPVSVDGSVQISGGFWARRILPYVVVGVITAAAMAGLVLLGYWLVAAGVLV